MKLSNAIACRYWMYFKDRTASKLDDCDVDSMGTGILELDDEEDKKEQSAEVALEHRSDRNSHMDNNVKAEGGSDGGKPDLDFSV